MLIYCLSIQLEEKPTRTKIFILAVIVPPTSQMVTCQDTYPIVAMLIECLSSLMFCLQCPFQPIFFTVPRLQLNWTAFQYSLVYTVSSLNWFLDLHLPKSHPFHRLWHLWFYHQQRFPWCVKANFKGICFLPRCKVYQSLTTGASAQSTAVLLWKERRDLKWEDLCKRKALFITTFMTLEQLSLQVLVSSFIKWN